MKKEYEIKYSFWCNKIRLIISIKRNIIFMVLTLALFSILFSHYYDCCNLHSLLNDKDLSKSFVISLFAGIYTIVWARIKFKLSKDKMVKDLFKDFNERYTGEMNDLFEELRNAKPVEIAKRGESLLKQNNLIIDYLNLCAEEFYWYKKRRIPSFVWRNWENGILKNLKIEEVYKMLCKEGKRYKDGDTYYGFISYIKIVFAYRKILIYRNIN